MKNTNWMVALGMGILLMPWAGGAQANPGLTTHSETAQLVPLDQAASDAQLDKLFEVTRVRQQMAAAAQAMPQVIKQQFNRQLDEMEKDHPEMSSMTGEQREAVNRIMEKFMSQAMTLYTTDEMMTDMKAIYREHLTRDDVNAITAFYSTPAGQHMLDMVPAIMQEYLPKAMTRMQEKMRPLIVEMSKEIAEVMRSQSEK